jgi:DNA polymerase III delta prime subunit
MKETFLTRYAPKTLAEFGTHVVVRELMRVDMLRLLIVGGPGTGKSTLARLVASEYYTGCTNVKENVLVINCLREQGIQYYRTEVRCFCQTTSTTTPKRKKMILLDDLDLITEQGQQVFLNCIDKYGGRVHYVATASTPQKIIECIHSRLLCVKLPHFSNEFILGVLRKVAAAEEIAVDPEVELDIVRRSSASLRQMLNYLEKFKLLGLRVTAEVAESCCTNIHDRVLEAFTADVLCGNLPGAIAQIHAIYQDGYSVMDILDAYFSFVKSATLSDEQKYKFIKIICKYIVFFNQLHEHQIELSFFTADLVATI